MMKCKRREDPEAAEQADMEAWVENCAVPWSPRAEAAATED